jgi:hypothetical protein
VQQRSAHDRLLFCFRQEAVQLNGAGQPARGNIGRERRRFGPPAHHVDGEATAAQPLRDGQDAFGALVGDQPADHDQRAPGRGGRRGRRYPVRDQVDVTPPAQPLAHGRDGGG